MKSLFWVLALFALAVGVSLAMRFNDGYVVVVLYPYRADASLNLVILLAVIGFAVCYVLLRAVALASSLPRRVRESRARRQREKATETFAESVRLYLAGEKRQAIDALAGLRGKSGWAALAAALAVHIENEPGAIAGQREAPASAAQPDPDLSPAPPAVIEPDAPPAVIESDAPAAVIESDAPAAQEETGIAKD